MSFLTPPAWLENSSDHNAQDYRVALASLVGGVDVDPSGVCGYGDLKVTEKSGTPNMSVDVAAGAAIIKSTRSDDQGAYHARSTGTINVPLSAADGSNPRIDRILVQVRDEAQDAALTQNDVRILVVEGTPAASPAAPTITVEDYIELAQVEVPASATSITNSDITDMRVAAEPWARPRGEVLYAEATANSSGVTSGSTDWISTTFTAVAGRKYRVSFGGALNGTVVGDVGRLGVLIGGTTEQRVFLRFGARGGPGQEDVSKDVRVSGLSAGSTAAILRVDRPSGTGKVIGIADTNRPAYLMVEDVGGAVG